MGVDALYFVKVKAGERPPDTGDSEDTWRAIEPGLDRPPGATHELRTGQRFCSAHGEPDAINFRRWPGIRRILVVLLNHCEKVWCDSDSLYDWATADRMTWELLGEYDAKYRSDTGGLDPSEDIPQVPSSFATVKAWRDGEPVDNPFPSLPVGAIVGIEGFNGWFVVSDDGRLRRRPFARDWY